MKSVKAVAALAVLALLAGCSGTGVLNTVSRPSGAVAKDVAYGPLPRYRLDIYSPDTMTETAPVLVFFHGGSWQYGDKADYPFLANALAKRGIQTVLVNYRLHPEVVHPAFVEDAAKALAHVRRTVGAGRPVYVAGHSAGAHLAALVALDPRFLAAEGTHVCEVAAGVIGMAGPYDFTPVEPVFKTIFPAETLAQSRPVNYAGNRAPPFLLLHGTADTTVLPARSEEMAAALRAAGNRAEVKFYEGVGHLYIVGAFSPIIRRTAPTLADIVAFIGAEGAKGHPGCGPR